MLKIQIFTPLFKQIVSNVDNFNNGERLFRHSETHIEMEERHTVDTFRIIVITRSRILSQDGLERFELVGRNKGSLFVGHHHFERRPPYLINKSTARLGVGIGISHIGFYVVDRRTVHEICALNPNDRSQQGINLHTDQSDTRESQVIRTER